MDEKDRSLIEKLCDENPHFRKLFEEHLLFEKQLREMDERRYLTPDEEMDRRRMQKLKLVGKDEMETILSEYRQ